MEITVPKSSVESGTTFTYWLAAEDGDVPGVHVKRDKGDDCAYLLLGDDVDKGPWHFYEREHFVALAALVKRVLADWPAK